METKTGSPEYITQQAILSTKNEYVDEINKKMINDIPGEAKEFTSYETLWMIQGTITKKSFSILYYLMEFLYIVAA